MNLWNYIREHMQKYPNQTVGEENAVLTYEELIIYAETFKKKLLGETCCLICCHSEMATAMALLGCFAAEVTAVPLSVRYGEIYLRKILENFNPSCLITDKDGEVQIYHVEDSNVFIPDEHPTLIMWTSGTTGVPKGVMLSEKNIITNVQDILEYFTIESSDTILIFRPLYHCAVLTGEFISALIRGVKIVFCSEPFNPYTIVGLLKQWKVTVLGGTPTLFHMLSRFTIQNNIPFLNHMVISGECMNESVGQKIRDAFPNAKIYHVYGLTEACPRISYMPPEYFDRAPDCVGIPLSSVKIEIRDRAGNPVNSGEEGILWVQGKNIMQGYYNRQDLTEKVLQDGWLCTGDIACMREGRWLKIIGRSDDMIIRAGMNIYPQEVEAELKKDPRTDEVFIYGYEDPLCGTQLGVKISGDFFTEDDVRAMCVERLPPFQVPMKIEIVTELPKNSSGKVIRVKC